MAGQVTFIPTRDLYVQWNRYALYKVMRRRGLFLIVLCALVACLSIALVTLEVVRRGGVASWIASGSSGSKFIALLGPSVIVMVALLPRLWGRRWASLPGMMAQQEISWNDTGITQSRVGASTTIGWEGVTQVLSDRHNVYVVTGHGKAIVAGLSIPRSAFVTEAAADGFVAEARGRVAAAAVAQPTK